MAIDLAAYIKTRMLFLNKFFRMPQAIGSVTPSSKALARRMVASIPWQEVHGIAELGAGTGAITKFIHEAKQQSSKVILFETDQQLREQLIEQYPDSSCYKDACHLEQAIKNEGINQLDCIVSGLPFFNFPQSVRDRLIQQILQTLKPGGRLIAFQYSQQMKKQLNRHFDLVNIAFVPFNIPPAFVYVCRKK